MRFGFGFGLSLAMRRASAGGGGDVTAPVLQSAVINAAGTTLTLTYNEALDTGSVPTITPSGTASTVSSVNVTGATVVSTFNTPVFQGETVAITSSGSPIQDVAGNDGATLSGFVVTNLSTVLATPLGVANYTLYFDPALYGFDHGQTLSAAITPSVGASVLTPTTSPTYSDLGIGGRGAVVLGDATNAYLDAAGYAALLDGSNKVLSGAVRCQRTGNESGVIIGWGRGSATDQYFEIFHSSAGLLGIRKDGPSETRTYTSATAALGFTAHTIGWTIHAGGTTATVYLDGVAVADLTNVDISLTTPPAITQCRIGTTGRSTGGTDDFAGNVGQVALGLTGVSWTAQNHLDTHNFWVAQQPPATVGTPIGAIGDSLTKAAAQHGWRGYKQDRFVARGQAFDWQGSASDGNWADNQHSGVNGSTLAQIQSRATAQYGTGKPYSGVELVYACMIGTNSLSDANGYVDTATAIAAWDACITAIDTAITSTNPTARIVVTTLPNYHPSASTYARQQAFNAALPAAITAWNAAHPTRKLFFADIAAALGAWNSAYMIDEVHPNNAGNQIIGASIDGATDADGNTLVAYEATIAA